MTLSFDLISQIVIGLNTAAAAWLTSDAKRPRRRAGFILGLCGQPFWIWQFWFHGQYIMLTVAFYYVYAWGRGIWNNRPPNVMDVAAEIMSHFQPTKKIEVVGAVNIKPHAIEHYKSGKLVGYHHSGVTCEHCPSIILGEKS